MEVMVVVLKDWEVVVLLIILLGTVDISSSLSSHRIDLNNSND